MPKKEEQTTKALTLRLRQDDWKRVAHLAVDLDTTVTALIIEGLNKVLKAHGKPEIKAE